MEKLVTFKMEEKFIAEVDRHYKRFGFSTRAEFMRTAIRNELEKRIVHIAQSLKGRGTTRKRR